MQQEIFFFALFLLCFTTGNEIRNKLWKVVCVCVCVQQHYKFQNNIQIFLDKAV